MKPYKAATAAAAEAAAIHFILHAASSLAALVPPGHLPV